jgi:hypothetical protein
LIACGALCWPLPSQPGERSVEGAQRLKDFWKDVNEVTVFIRGNAVVQWAIGVWTLGAILGIVIAMLAPGFAVSVLGIRAEDSVFVLAPAGVGMVVCTAVLSRWGHDWDKYRLVNAGLAVVSLSILGLGVLGPLWRQVFGPLEPGAFNLQHIGGMIAITMFVALVAGIGFVCMIVPAQTIIQERAPVTIRGRVFSIQFMLSNVNRVGRYAALCHAYQHSRESGEQRRRGCLAVQRAARSRSRDRVGSADLLRVSSWSSLLLRVGRQRRPSHRA